MKTTTTHRRAYPDVNEPLFPGEYLMSGLGRLLREISLYLEFVAIARGEEDSK